MSIILQSMSDAAAVVEVLLPRLETFLLVVVPLVVVVILVVVVVLLLVVRASVHV